MCEGEQQIYVKGMVVGYGFVLKSQSSPTSLFRIRPNKTIIPDYLQNVWIKKTHLICKFMNVVHISLFLSGINYYK